MKNGLLVGLVTLLLTTSSQASELQISYGVDIGHGYSWVVDFQEENGKGINLETITVHAGIDAKIFDFNLSDVIAEIKFSYNSNHEKIEKTGYLSFLDGGNYQVVSISKLVNNLLYIPYEKNLPLIWPVNEEYWDALQEQLIDEETSSSSIVYSISKTDSLITLSEIRDDTPVDGCLCNITLQIDPDSGVLIELVMKSTSYYVIDPPHYEKVTIYGVEDPVVWSDNTEIRNIPGTTFPVILGALLLITISIRPNKFQLQIK